MSHVEAVGVVKRFGPFVALDGVEGTPVAVPAWTPASDEDKRLSEYALQVMALSKGIEQTVARYREAGGKG